MYTAKVLRKAKDLQIKKLFIDFEYLKDGVQVATEQKDFPLDATLLIISSYANSVIKRLESSDANLDSIPVGTELDLSSVEYVPTADDTTREAWLADWAKLVSAQKLIDHGVTLTTQQQSAVTTIRNRIGSNLKVEYLGLI